MNSLLFQQRFLLSLKLAVDHLSLLRADFSVQPVRAAKRIAVEASAGLPVNTSCPIPD